MMSYDVIFSKYQCFDNIILDLKNSGAEQRLMAYWPSEKPRHSLYISCMVCNAVLSDGTVQCLCLCAWPNQLSSFELTLMANALKTEGKRMRELWTAKSDKKEELKRTNNIYNKSWMRKLQPDRYVQTHSFAAFCIWNTLNVSISLTHTHLTSSIVLKVDQRYLNTITK